MGPEHNGRVRGMGLGPTPTKFYGLTSYNVGKRWENTINASQAEEVKVLKEQLQAMTAKYDQVTKKLQRNIWNDGCFNCIYK